MKKNLSIFWVAVLSLTLLYKPCVAVDDKKEMISSETKESVSVVGGQAEKPSGNEIKAKAEATQRKTAEKSKLKIVFLALLNSGICK